MTYEADEAGVLKIVAQEGDTLAVGETIAQIGEGGGSRRRGRGRRRRGRRRRSQGRQRRRRRRRTEAKADSDDEDERPSEPTSDEDATRPKATSEAEPTRRRGRSRAERRRTTRRRPTAASDGRSKAEDDGAEAGRRRGVRGGIVGGRDGRRSRRRRERARQGVAGRAPDGARTGRRAGRAQGLRPGRADREGRRGGRRRATALPRRRRRRPRNPQPPKEKAPAGDGASGRGETTIEDLTRLQQTIARRMAESKATAPEFVITAEVDMEEAVEFRKQLKGAVGEDAIAPSFNDFVVKSAALALREFPRANGAYRDGKFELYSRINVGVAVAGQDAPGRADDLRRRPQVARGDRPRRARSGGEGSGRARSRLPSSRAARSASPTWACSASSGFIAVINPPQAAILAVGEMTPRPVVRDGEVDGAPDHGDHALLRPPDPLRRGRRGVPRPHPRAPGEPAQPRALSAEHLRDRGPRPRRVVQDLAPGEAQHGVPATAGRRRARGRPRTPACARAPRAVGLDRDAAACQRKSIRYGPSRTRRSA